MKGKLALGLALVSVATTGFALETSKSRVINHKEWNAGSIKFTIKSNPAKAAEFRLKHKMKLKDDGESQSLYFSTYTATSEAKGYVGQSLSLPDFAYISISNESNHARTLGYTVEICAQDSEHTQQCSYYWDEVEVQPWDYFSNFFEPELETIYKVPGVFHYSLNVYMNTDWTDPIYGSGSSSSSSAFEIV